MLERQATDEAQAQLLQRIAARDLAALEEFYDQISTPLFSVALRILSEAAEAEEVIQDVFVQIWEKATTFDPTLGSSFHWALSITRHRAIDRLRARQRRARLVDDLQKTAAEVDPSGPSGPTTVLGSDDVANIRSALAGLPQEQRSGY